MCECVCYIQRSWNDCCLMYMHTHWYSTGSKKKTNQFITLKCEKEKIEVQSQMRNKLLID